MTGASGRTRTHAMAAGSRRHASARHAGHRSTASRMSSGISCGTGRARRRLLREHAAAEPHERTVVGRQLFGHGEGMGRHDAVDPPEPQRCPCAVTGALSKRMAIGDVQSPTLSMSTPPASRSWTAPESSGRRASRACRFPCTRPSPRPCLRCDIRGTASCPAAVKVTVPLRGPGVNGLSRPVQLNVPDAAK